MSKKKMERDTVVIKTQDQKVRVRYLGSGYYWAGDFEFTPLTPVHEVPEKLAEYLLSMEDLFAVEE